MSRVFDAVVNDSDLLAHWTYDEAWYSRIIEREYEEHKERNTALLIVIDGMLLICALFFIVFVPEGGIETGIVLLLIAGLMVLISKVTPGLFRRRKARMAAEAWISTKGLIYEGTVYPYSGFLYGFTGVSYRDEKEPALVFRFYQITGAKIYDPFEITFRFQKVKRRRQKQYQLN
jgi:multisubunit Na+/H+ antiporter MnhB subunit